jgi:enolase
MTAIVEVHGREILDSRVILPSRWTSCWNRAPLGRAAVPSGTSTGTREAVERRDGEKKRFGGKGESSALTLASLVGWRCGETSVAIREGDD